MVHAGVCETGRCTVFIQCKGVLVSYPSGLNTIEVLRGRTKHEVSSLTTLLSRGR